MQRVFAFLIATLALTIIAPGAAHAAPVGDTWTGPDKALHLGAGALIAGAVTAATNSRAWGFGAGCAVGVGKEVLDPTFSNRDAIVTCAGAALGAYAAGWMIERRGPVTVVSRTWGF
jgi:hypothetical protein